MKKILRLIAGLAVLASFAIIAPSAEAGHEAVPGTGWPGATGHETRPAGFPLFGEPIGSIPSSVCSVTGTVSTTAYAGFVDPVGGFTVPFLSGPGPQHTTILETGVYDPTLVEALTNNPSHTHYQFNDLALTCVGEVTGLLDVVSGGGNDGHIPVLPEDGGTPVTGEHATNVTHHGSVNLSAWSHSSGYAGNPCGDAGANKARISASQGGPAAHGWVKYDRLATVVKAWGAFLCGGGPAAGSTFWSELILTPDIDITGPTGEFAIHGLARIYG